MLSSTTLKNLYAIVFTKALINQRPISKPHWMSQFSKNLTVSCLHLFLWFLKNQLSTDCSKDTFYIFKSKHDLAYESNDSKFWKTEIISIILFTFLCTKFNFYQFVKNEDYIGNSDSFHPILPVLYPTKINLRFPCRL